MATTPKTQERSDSVEEFIASWPEAQRSEGMTLCNLIRKATGQEPVRWGTKLIGFGKYTYTLANGKLGESAPVAFAPRTGGLTLYLVGGQEKYQDDLSAMSAKDGGKSCVYLKKLSEIDFDKLSVIISDSYAQTVKEHA